MKNSYRSICFFGHSIISNQVLIKERLLIKVEKYILIGYKVFYIGTRGMFDILALEVCRELRKIYDIKIYIVLSNFSIFSKYGGKIIKECYKNEELILFDIEEEYFKNYIIATNKKMVDCCNLVICYIDYSYRKSGAIKAVNYAIKQNKEIINIYNIEDKPSLTYEQFKKGN